MKIGLRAKFGFFFLMFGIVLLAAMWMMVYLVVGDAVMEQYGDSIAKIVDVTAFRLDLTAEEMKTYAETKKPDARYGEVLSQLRQIQNISEFEYVYIVYPTGKDSAVWLFDTAAVNAEELGSDVSDYMDESFAPVREVYETGKKSNSLEATDTELGNLVSFYYPLKDENGKTVAVLGVDKSFLDISSVIMYKVLQGSRQLVLLVAAGVVSLLLFVQFGVIRSIRSLKQGVLKMADGELGVQISCRRRDEIGDITAVFNRMSLSIGRHIGEMEELNGAYQKFVPRETFEILQKDSVVDLHLGDQANTELTLLSMEPENFYGITRNMTSEETFRYINGVLAKTVPVILKEGGTVERFEKAGLGALFRNSSEHALRAAILACEIAGKDGGKIAIGITHGAVMIGVAGHNERMDIISISGQAKIAAFLKRLAANYHAGVLISKTAAEQIDGFRKNYHCRFIGYVKQAGADTAEGIYDVFDGEEQESRRFKQITKEVFEQGVELFYRKKYEEARNAFIEVLKQNRKDGNARDYLELCSKYAQGVPEEDTGWIWEL